METTCIHLIFIMSSLCWVLDFSRWPIRVVNQRFGCDYLYVVNSLFIWLNMSDSLYDVLWVFVLSRSIIFYEIMSHFDQLSIMRFALWGICVYCSEDLLCSFAWSFICMDSFPTRMYTRGRFVSSCIWWSVSDLWWTCDSNWYLHLWDFSLWSSCGFLDL